MCIEVLKKELVWGIDKSLQLISIVKTVTLPRNQRNKAVMTLPCNQ